MLKKISIKMAFIILLVISMASFLAIGVTDKVFSNIADNNMNKYRAMALQNSQNLVNSVKITILGFEELEKEKHLTREVAQQKALQILNKMQFADADGHMNDDYIFAFNSENKIIAQIMKSQLNQNVNNVSENYKQAYTAIKNLLQTNTSKDKILSIDYNLENSKGTITTKTAYVYRTPLWGWTVGAGIHMDEINDSQTTLNFLEMVVMEVIIVSAFIMLIFTSSITIDIVHQIRQITAHVGRMAKGDLSEKVKRKNYNSSIGDIGIQIEIFRKQLGSAKDAEIQQEEKLQHVEEEAKQDLLERIEIFEGKISTVIDKFTESSNIMKSAASHMSEVASTSEQKSVSISNSANQSAENIDSVAISAEEINTSITEVSNNIAEGAVAVQKGVIDGEKTIAKINTLVKSVGRISEVVSLITDIADQTNLLALNATIESARAGEAGKGFAVVASEVKSLASQTAKATEDIRLQIETVQSETSEASTAVNNIVGIVQKTSKRYSAIASAIEEQTATIGEINRNMETIRQGSQKISSGVEEVKSGSITVNSSSLQVLDSSEQLSNETINLQDAVHSFLSSMK